MMPEPVLSPAHMPFGQYQGWLLRNVPLDYLAWLLTSELEDVRQQMTRPRWRPRSSAFVHVVPAGGRVA